MYYAYILVGKNFLCLASKAIFGLSRLNIKKTAKLRFFVLKGRIILGPSNGIVYLFKENRS
jgi:hypothetical protein